MKRTVILWVVLAVATLAYAAKDAVDRYGGSKPVYFTKGLYVGMEGKNDPPGDTMNKTTALFSHAAAYDFPSVDPSATTSPGWAETPTYTKVGVLYGDDCHMKSIIGADGGSSFPTLAPNGELSCRTVTNGIIGRFKAYPVLDGGTGAVNLPDSGYTYYIRSMQ